MKMEKTTKLSIVRFTGTILCCSIFKRLQVCDLFSSKLLTQLCNGNGSPESQIYHYMKMEMYSPKGLLTVALLLWTFLDVAEALPSKEKLKIRIHIPLKHHTHIHTKTLVRKIPLPVPIPVKDHSEEHHYAHKKHHHVLEADDDFEGYEYSKKKRRTNHPFL